MLQKLRLCLVVLVLVLAIFTSCAPERFAKNSYFDGAVIVEYRQSYAVGSNDYLTFRFYEKGAYEVSFKGRVFSSTPKNFTKTIEVAPREIVIKQRALPDVLQITILKDGKSESHKFF